MEIILLENEAIDKKAWDECLFASPGFELYMQASYLDVVFPKWKGLVAGNYEAIFPICEKPFLLWKTLRQPFFTGAWPVTGINKESVQKIIEYLPRFFQKYQYIDINIMNDISGLEEICQKKHQKFQQLVLSPAGFIPDKSLRKNLSRASKLGIETLERVNHDEFIKGIKAHLLTHHNALNSASLAKLSELIQNCERIKGKCIGIQNQEKDFHAAQFFIAEKNRLHFILCYSTEEGRKSSALHALQAELIDKHLQPNGVLHFGGSNIERVAEYNRNFGAKDVSYIRLIRKKFPFTYL